MKQKKSKKVKRLTLTLQYIRIQSRLSVMLFGWKRIMAHELKASGAIS